MNLHILFMRQLSQVHKKRLQRYLQKKWRREDGIVIAEGLRATGAALDSGRPVAEVVCADGVWDALPETHQRRLLADQTPVWTAGERDLAALSDVQTSQGIIAYMRWQPQTAPDPPPDGLWMALEGVADPGNLGTLLRTAVWFGVQGVLLGHGCVEAAAPKVIRAGAGAVFELPVCEDIDLPGLLQRWRSDGWRIIAAVPEGGRPLRRIRTDARRLLVLGNEAHGLSPDVLAQVTDRVTIPGSGVESLNVAVAGALCCYELTGRGKEQSRE